MGNICTNHEEKIISLENVCEIHYKKDHDELQEGEWCIC
jgi:hypothetical protein